MSAPRDPHRALLRALLHAAGLSAGAALGVACGGKVIVDGEATAGGSGGSGGAGSSAVAGSSSSAATTGAGGSFPCDITVSPGESLVIHCPSTLAFPNCPPSTSPEVFSAMSQDLNPPPPTEFCCEPGCAGSNVSSVVCGPDPLATSCCYQAILTPQDWCMGRPFTVGSEARSAAVEARSDWQSPRSPDLSALDAPTRAELSRAYREDALLEHASIASFSRFVLQLLALGAPAALVAEATRAIHDEIEHATICFGLASAYAGETLGPSPLPMNGALDGVGDPSAIVAAAVREGCVGETLAALHARAAAEQARDPVVRAALRTIADDEERHAALAFRFVAWALGSGPPAAREGALRALRELLSSESAAPARFAELEPHPAILRAHGRASAIEIERARIRGLAEVVEPAARALLLAHEEASLRDPRAPTASADLC